MANFHEGSAAYDLALFAPKATNLVVLAPNKKLEKAERRRTRVQSFVNAVVTLVLASLVVGAISLLVTSQVQLTEMNRTILQTDKEMAQLQSEYVRLQAELERKTSAQNVATYAAENAMRPVEGEQIAYFSISKGDTVDLARGTPKTWWESLWEMAVDFFSQF